MGNASNKMIDKATDSITDAADHVVWNAKNAYYAIAGEEQRKGPKKSIFVPGGTKIPDAPKSDLPELPKHALDMDAQELYDIGSRTVNEEGKEALAGQYFAAACDKGMGKSCMIVAEMWKIGAGCDPNPKMAAKAYEHACARGEGEGCYGLAEFFLQANHDPERTAELLEAACGLKKKPNEQPSCSALGAMWLSGQGKPQNMEQAARIFKRGCALGEMQACMKLGEMYLEGVGVEKCPPCALKVLEAAKKQGFVGIDPLLAKAVQEAQGRENEKQLKECLRG